MGEASGGSPFDIHSPTGTGELLAALDTQAAAIADYMAALPLEEFLAPQGEKWSPADHLRHLARSVKGVSGGLAVPKVALALRFGPTLRGSRPFEEVAAYYREALARGVDAGRFAPSAASPQDATEEWRAGVLRRWRDESDSLVARAGRWGERALDHLRMPHPALGKLTAREMLYFTLYHNAHHARMVVGRRGPAI
ncbi:MAG: DinB family protein [Gemmatimonadota bacterium]|nr:DinB family protein [Gemmatimonadota bacterium]MDH5759607.1 DinB family protein [Gemmatimonadota bacterium]